MIKKLTWTVNIYLDFQFLTKLKTNNSHTTQKRLPFKQFQVLLTPSSGSFSSFPHGTCSLSVSRPYLAWDGTYHPLRAAIPNNSTLWNASVQLLLIKRETRLSLSMAVLSSNTCFSIKVCLPSIRLQFCFQGQILMMSFSFFTRHYWRNPS